MQRSVAPTLLLLASLAACGDDPSSADRPDVASVRVFTDRALMQTGDTALVTVRALDRDGRSITEFPAGMEPVVTVSDPSILVVLPGRVIAVGSGRVEIMASVGTVSGSKSMRVNPSVLNLGAVVHFNQVVQNAAGGVLLVPDRAALLRIFVQADRANFLPLPAVRVRLFRDDEEVGTHLLQRSGFDVPHEPPTLASEGWDLHVPAELMRAGLGWLLELDPDGVLPRETDGPVLHPASGVPQRVHFVDVPPLRIRFVPIHHEGAGTGNVTNDNVDEYLTVTRAIHPVVDIERDVREPYTPLADPDSPSYWDDLVFEIDMLRVAEGAGRYYYGIARGNTGRAILGAPAAVSYDNRDRARFASTVAHELGHNFGRLHSGTCTAGDPFVDPAYPYPNGTIGAIGYDAATRTLLGPDTTFDIMSSCGQERWISDYMYSGALLFRRFLEMLEMPPGGGAVHTGSGRSLLVRGRVDGNRVRLEPAFRIDAPALLPDAPGAYLLEGRDDSGRVLFAHSFDPAPIAHGAGGAASFAFAVPLDFPVESLAAISVTGRGATAEVRSPRALPGRLALRTSFARSAVFARRLGADVVEVRWDPAIHDAALITDALTGAVLGLARGGSARLRTTASELEIRLSDGVAGAVRRVPVQ